MPRRIDRRLQVSIRPERIARQKVVVVVELPRVNDLCVDELLTQLDELEPLPLQLPFRLPSHEPLDEAGGLRLLRPGSRRVMSSASAACAPLRKALGLGWRGAPAQRKPLPRWRCEALRSVALDDGSGVAGVLIQDHAFDETAFDGSFPQVEAPFFRLWVLRAIIWALAVAALDDGCSSGVLDRCANEVSR